MIRALINEYRNKLSFGMTKDDELQIEYAYNICIRV